MRVAAADAAALNREELARPEDEIDAATEDVVPLDIFGDVTLTGCPSLPLGEFPAAIRDFADDEADRLGVDPAMLAVPALVAVAIAAGDRHRIQPRTHDTGWTEPPILRVATVIESGEKKTTAFRKVVAPLQQIEREWWETDHHHRTRYDLECRRYKKQVEQWARTGAGPEPVEPVRPPQRRLCFEDATSEAAAHMLVDNPRGLGALHDELSGWFGSFDAYRNRAGKDRAFWLRSADGGPMLVDRIHGGHVPVENCAISIIGSIQPEPFKRLAGKITDDGLVQRFIVIFPRPASRGVDRAPNDAAVSRYAALLRRLIELPAPAGPYRLAPEAQTERDLVSTIAENMAILPTTSAAFRAHLRKWEGLYARLLLVWHVAEHAGANQVPPPVVTIETARRVARFMVDYVLPNAARFYSELLGDEHLSDARWIAGHILAHGLEKITARDVGRAYRELRGDARRISAVMDVLTLANWVTPSPANRPSAPLSRWSVNLAVHLVFAERAAAEQQRRERVRQQIADAARALGMTGPES